MKISLRIVLLLTGLLVAVPAGCLWASPITIEGSAINVVANDLQILTLEGNRGFFLSVSRNGGTFTDVSGIPINHSAGSWFSGNFSCCAFVERSPVAHRATLHGNNYIVGDEGTANFALVSVTTRSISLPGFDYNCVGLCGASIELPASLSGTFTHTDAGQSTTEDLAGQGIAHLFLEQGRAAHGLYFGSSPGLDARAWQRPSIVYTFGVSPNSADLTWRGADGEPLQASPEPATLLLVGAGAAGLGLARWVRRRGAA